MDTHTPTKFGKLTIVDADYRTDDYGNREALVECECGRRKPVLLMNLKSGRTKSCGLCTSRGGTRPRPYKSRKTTMPSGKAAPVITNSIAVNGRQTSA